MVLSDIEIANSVQMKPITDIAAELGLTEDDISLYGKYKAKIDSNQLEQLRLPCHWDCQQPPCSLD